MVKKVFVLLVVAFSCSPPLFSQVKVNVDSLITVLAEYPKEDTVKVNLLIALVTEYRGKNTVKASAYADEALRISEQLQNDLFISNSYIQKSIVSYIKGDFKEAETYCRSAVVFLEKGNKYPNESADATMFLGSIAISQGQVSEALTYFEAALAVFETTRNVKKVISTMVGIANCHTKLGNTQKALELYQEGIRRNEALNNKGNFALLYSNIAEIYDKTGNYVLALDYRLKTIDILKKMENNHGLAKEYNNISGVYFILNDKEEARKYLQKALDIHRTLGDKYGVAHASINISLTYDDDKTAIEELKKALVYSQEVNNKYLLGLAFQNLCFKHINIEDYRTAYTYLKNVFEVEKEVKNKENINKAKLNGAAILIKCSDADLLDFGLDPKSRYEKAREYLDQVLLPENNAKVNQKTAAWLYSSMIYEKQQNYPLAYEAFRQYVTLKDSTAGDDIRKQITRKEIQYEFDKKETEIKYQQRRTADLLEQERLLTVQQSQALLLNNQTLALREKDLVLSNQERDLAHLAFLKEQAEKQEKIQMLSLSEEREKGKEQDLNLKNLALLAQGKQNFFLSVIAILSLLGLGAISYFYILITKQKKLITQQNQINEHTIDILSHDIKAPLMGVKVMLKMLNKEDSFVAQASQSLEAQINSVNYILSNLLSMKKLSMSNHDKEVSAPVNAIVQNLQQVLGVDIQSKNLTIQNELTSDIFLPIAPEKLQFILHNLLSNAIKFSFPNQTIRIFQKGKTICIQDFGVGISPGKSSKFMREVATPQEGTNGEMGNGMGLFLIGTALQNESVKVVFESPETGGTLVKIT